VAVGQTACERNAGSGLKRTASAGPALAGLTGNVRTAARWLLAAVYLSAGVLHLATPGPFLAITPDWVPWPKLVIAATGLCEIAGGVGLLTRRWRYAAGVALALYAVCVFPANVKHAIDDLSAVAPGLGWWYHVPRLLLQPVLVWWALVAGDVIRRRPRLS